MSYSACDFMEGVMLALDLTEAADLDCEQLTSAAMDEIIRLQRIERAWLEAMRHTADLDRD
jgi:hypothetical protein